MLCEKSGGGRGQQDFAFMVGMLSLLDVLFSLPMSEVVKPLNFPADVLGALIGRDGYYGKLLMVTEQACGDISGISVQSLMGINVTPAAYYEVLIEAYAWANLVCQDILHGE